MQNKTNLPPHRMSKEQRLHEATSLMARAFVRLKAHHNQKSATHDPESQVSLDNTGHPCLYGATGENSTTEAS